MMDLINLIGASQTDFTGSRAFSNYIGMSYFSNPLYIPVGTFPKSATVFNPAPWSYSQIYNMTYSLPWGFNGVTGGHTDLAL